VEGKETRRVVVQRARRKSRGAIQIRNARPVERSGVPQLSHGRRRWLGSSLRCGVRRRPEAGGSEGAVDLVWFFCRVLATFTGGWWEEILQSRPLTCVPAEVTPTCQPPHIMKYSLSS
jgi:hypothetical protein